MSNIEASSAPVKINDVEFLMKPLTDKDSGEINNFIKMGIMSLASDFCSTLSDQRVIDATMSAAVEKSSKVDWMTQPERLDKLENLLHLLWVGVRNSVENFNKARFTELVMSGEVAENLGKLMEAMTLVNPILQSRRQKNATESQQNS